MKTTTQTQIILTAYNMPTESTEADFDAYVEYVNQRIDALVGDSVEVDSYPYDNGPAGDSISAPHEMRDTISDALRVLWDEFCADASAWPGNAA